MEVLKIKAYQLFANYRTPMSYNFIDTYPLPTFSTVKGWFHSVIEAKEYIPVSMSIQGNSASVIYDMQNLVKFDRKRNDKEQVILEDFGKALTTSPTYVANVFDTELLIYIHAEKQYLQKFREKVFDRGFPSLGRYEDLLRIDYLDFINLEEKKFSSMLNFHKVDYGIYISKENAKKLNITGINYRLNFKYEVIEGLRYFDKKEVVYIDNTNIESGSFLFDVEDERIVELIGSN